MTSEKSSNNLLLIGTLILIMVAVLFFSSFFYFNLLSGGTMLNSKVVFDDGATKAGEISNQTVYGDIDNSSISLVQNASSENITL